MGLPRNVKKSIDTLTEDPKVRAACEIEAYLNGLKDKKDKLYKTRDDLPCLSTMAREFIDSVWIPQWRKSPYIDLNTAEGWKKQFVAQGLISTHNVHTRFEIHQSCKNPVPLPKDYNVRLHVLSRAHIESVQHLLNKMRSYDLPPSCKDKNIIEFGIHVSSPVFNIPKSLGKQLRFAARCKNPEKKARLVGQADAALVKALGIPGLFLAPTWYTSTMKCSVGVILQYFIIPYTKEMDEVSRKSDDIEAGLKEIKEKEEEFTRILPLPVRSILGMMNRSMIPHPGLVGWW